MHRLVQGDRLRADISDETDPDHKRYHGVHCTVVAVLEDDADTITGDVREAAIFRVYLDHQ